MNNETSAKKKKGLSWNIIAILVVTILPIAGAYISYFTGLGVSTDTVNEGVLLKANSPKKLQDLLENAQGDIPNFERNYTWRVIIPITENCGQQCKQNLYTSRQVHIRLGEKADRVERYAVNIGGESGAEFLASIAKEYPQVKTFSVQKEQWSRWIEGANVPPDGDEKHYYILVDQVGFAMMYYTVDHSGNQFLKDLKQILRYSLEK